MEKPRWKTHKEIGSIPSKSMDAAVYPKLYSRWVHFFILKVEFYTYFMCIVLPILVKLDICNIQNKTLFQKIDMCPSNF